MDERILKIIEETDGQWSAAYLADGRIVNATHGLCGSDAMQLQAILQYSNSVGIEIVTGADTYIFDIVSGLWYGADRFGLFQKLILDPNYALGTMMPRQEDYNKIMTLVNSDKKGWLAREKRPDKEWENDG